MGVKVSKAEYDALPELLKTKFIADGDSFVLVEEDVAGLKQSKETILTEKKAAEKELAELRKFKAEAEAAAQSANDDQLKKAGEFEKLKEQLEARHEGEIAKRDTEIGTLKSNVKRERLTNELIKKGVLPDRVEFLVSKLDADIELVSDEKGFSLRKSGGIGDEAEFNAMIDAAKTASPFFFAPSNASGSGASGSSDSGGNANTITRSQYDANPSQYGMQLAKGELSVVD